AALEFGQRLAQQVAGRVAAAGVVVLPLLVETGEAEVAGQHQRRRHRAVGGIAVDAGAHRAGGATAIGGVRGARAKAHTDAPMGSWGMATGAAGLPVPASSAASNASMRSVSLRKASWPYGERST